MNIILIDFIMPLTVIEDEILLSLHFVLNDIIALFSQANLSCRPIKKNTIKLFIYSLWCESPSMRNLMILTRKGTQTTRKI